MCSGTRSFRREVSAGRNSARRTAASLLTLGAVLSLVLAPGAGGAPGDATASRVADIQPGPASSNPQELFGAGSTVVTVWLFIGRLPP